METLSKLHPGSASLSNYSPIDQLEDFNIAGQGTKEEQEEIKRFQSNQNKLTYIIIILWTLVQLITFTKNIFIYNSMNEPMDYVNQLTRRTIPLLTGICFIFLINAISSYALKSKVNIKQLAFTHFLLATFVSVTMFAISVYGANQLGMSTFQNSSVLKYFMVEVDRMFLIYLLISVTTTAHHYFHESRLKDLALVKMQKAYQQAEIISLNNIVNPHMISNTLNNISSLVKIEPDEAQRMIVDFAHLLRQNLKNKDTIYTTVRHEHKFLKNYIQLQNTSKQKRYRLSFLYNKDIGNAILPKMILQPLVENAIKHTDLATEESLFIQITAGREGNQLFIQVKNQLGHFDPDGERTRQIGIGTENITKRLKLLYGSNYEFETLREDPAFTCSIKIPLRVEIESVPIG